MLNVLLSGASREKHLRDVVVRSELRNNFVGTDTTQVIAPPITRRGVAEGVRRLLRKLSRICGNSIKT
ncbi:MAG TPA: hypothetical protein VFK86_06525, partial [Bauldia sp.]|nr:hypothetical protein [Bauldia sp.]